MASLSSLSSSFSSLSFLPSFPRPSIFSNPSLSLKLKTHHSPLTLFIIHASSSSSNSDIDTTFFDNFDPNKEIPFNPPSPPDDYVPPIPFDEIPPKIEDKIAAAYEELYGTAYSGITILGNNIYSMNSMFKKGGISGLGRKKREKVMDGFDERVASMF